MRKAIFLFLACMVVLIGVAWDTEKGIAQPYILTVEKDGSGSGTVTSSPSGISCGSNCTGTYAQDKKVTLKAKATTGSYFAGWSGGGCSGTQSCVLMMNSDLSVTAVFEKKEPDLSVFPDSLDFGDVEIGEKVSEILKITNNGTGDLVGSISGLEGTDLRISGRSTFTIKPEKTDSFKVTCKPAEGATGDQLNAGPEGTEEQLDTREVLAVLLSGTKRTATLKISSNDPQKPEVDIPTEYTFVAPLSPYSLEINYDLDVSSPDIDGTFTYRGFIGFSLNGQKDIDCVGGTDPSAWSCQGSIDVNISATSSDNCTVTGSEQFTYMLTGGVTQNKLRLTMNLINVDNGPWTACCADSPCGSTVPFPISDPEGETYSLTLPFTDGGKQQISVNKTIEDFSIKGTQEWILHKKK